MAWEISSPPVLDPESHDPVFPALNQSLSLSPSLRPPRGRQRTGTIADSKTEAHEVAEPGSSVTLGQSLALCGSISPSEGKGPLSAGSHMPPDLLCLVPSVRPAQRMWMCR